jgi:hypothetical protein
MVGFRALADNVGRMGAWLPEKPTPSMKTNKAVGRMPKAIRSHPAKLLACFALRGFAGGEAARVV